MSSEPPRLQLRHLAREWALKLLYQADIARTSLDPAHQSIFWEQFAVDDDDAYSGRAKVGDEDHPVSLDTREWRKVREFADHLARGVLEHREELDERIARHAANWRLDRMAAVDRNLMRLSLYELLYCPEIPPVVSINEAVELAKEYGDSESSKFVNAILDKIRKTDLANGTDGENQP